MATTNSFTLTSLPNPSDRTVPPSTSSNSTSNGMQGADTYRWLVAWGIMLVILGLVNRTRAGHVIIYYSLWLILIFLLVTQYKFVIEALGPLGTPVPTSTRGDK